MSLKFAIERLGFGPCHHMVELLSCADREARQAEWSRISSGGDPDWESLLRGYRSTVDWPTCNFVTELRNRNPVAKVILTVRQDAEQWYDSISQTIFGPDAQPEFVLRFAKQALGDDLYDRAQVIDAYERHNTAIVTSVPRERLLIFDPSDGWAPLCEFLACPVPPEPFPHLYTRLQFKMVSRARNALPERWSARLARLSMRATSITHSMRR